MLYPVNPKGKLVATSADKGPVEVKRWTATKKMEVVLKHIRGESLNSLSREIGVPASQIEEWHQATVMGIEESPKSRGNEPLQAELDLSQETDRRAQHGERTLERSEPS